MMFAMTAAGLAMLFVSHNVADNIVASTHFDTPGAAARLHMGLYMGTNVLALLGGYFAGWGLAFPLRRRAPS
jgi:uncharacterized oligopeptide transporter (OPT) family protein